MVPSRPWRTFWRSFDGEWNSLLLIGAYNGPFFHCMWRVKDSCKLAKTSACIALYYRIQRMQRRRLTCRLAVNTHVRMVTRHFGPTTLRQRCSKRSSSRTCILLDFNWLTGWLCMLCLLSQSVTIANWGIGKMRKCGMCNAESKMRNAKCGMHVIGYQVLVLVLKVMDAGCCLYVHIFMKNIKSLKPFNFYNSNQLTPDLRFQQSRRDN